MEIQEFNEDLDEYGSNIIYVGKSQNKISVKYYQGLFAAITIDEKNVFDSKLIPYFKEQKIVQINASYKETIKSLDSLSLEILVKENDIIPLFKNNVYLNKIKKYKAFPVIVKNISNKILKIPSLTLFDYSFFKNKNNKWQSVRNSNYMSEGFGKDWQPCFELKPNEILIYAFPYFKKGAKQKVKIKFYDASSKEFEISIDDTIIINQHEKIIE